jgi:Lectin C-type domain
MKKLVVYYGAVFLVLAAVQTRADVIAGPITNPANGHDYYLLSPNTWTASEAEAENLGGTLAVIRSAAEQEWMFSNFGDYGGTNRVLWIGLHRQWQGGPFVWITDIKLDYANWLNGQPDNAGGVENCVEVWSGDNHGVWNDTGENQIRYGVVEVPGKSNEKSLAENEKSLIGDWYESGRPDRQAWIAGTDNKLFLITHDRHAARLTFTRKGVIYDADRQFGEIVKDKILWSNGTWWSRNPAEYEAGKNNSNKDASTIPSRN